MWLGCRYTCISRARALRASDTALFVCKTCLALFLTPAHRNSSLAKSSDSRSLHSKTLFASAVYLSAEPSPQSTSHTGERRKESRDTTAQTNRVSDISTHLGVSHASGTWEAGMSAASHSSSSLGRSVLTRWHAHIQVEICFMHLRAWHLYTHAGLQALATIFRSRWVVWRKIVSALSARRRMAIYVISTRQRLSNALEIWIALWVKGRALVHLGWLHTEKVLNACMGAFELHVHQCKAFKSVAGVLTRALLGALLLRYIDVWRHQVHVSEHVLHRDTSRWQRLSVRTLHAWLSAISRMRAAVVNAEWRASEQGELKRRRIMHHWRASASASTGLRNKTLLAAFQRLQQHRNLGRYRHRLVCAMHQRARLCSQRYALALLISDYCRRIYFAMTSDRIKICVARRISNQSFSHWRYHAWCTRRLFRIRKGVHRCLCASMMIRWDTTVSEAWRLDIKETRLLEIRDARARRASFQLWLREIESSHTLRAIHNRACRARLHLNALCISTAFRRWNDLLRAAHANYHRTLRFQQGVHRRLKKKGFQEITKYLELRVAFAVHMFRVRLWARHLLAHTLRILCAFVFKRRFDRC